MAANFSAVFSDNPLAAGLARAAGLAAARAAGQSGRPARRRPASGRWSSSTSCCRASSAKTAKAGAATLEQLEADWFAPLKKALGGKVDRISLIAPTVYGELRYTLTAGDRWKLWKSGKPIAETAKELAQ